MFVCCLDSPDPSTKQEQPALSIPHAGELLMCNLYSVTKGQAAIIAMARAMRDRTAGIWDAAPLEAELLIQADGLVGGSDAVLVIDDTAMAKKGKHSVGVAAQYASALGKTANCKRTLSRGHRQCRAGTALRCDLDRAAARKMAGALPYPAPHH
jgi:hypothetical protein